MKVAKMTPQARLMPMGMTTCAWVLFSNIVGSTPTKVVRLVNRIGRKRAPPALRTASSRGRPSLRLRLM